MLRNLHLHTILQRNLLLTSGKLLLILSEATVLSFSNTKFGSGIVIGAKQLPDPQLSLVGLFRSS
jgi:hypothetical protein